MSSVIVSKRLPAAAQVLTAWVKAALFRIVDSTQPTAAMKIVSAGQLPVPAGPDCPGRPYLPSRPSRLAPPGPPGPLCRPWRLGIQDYPADRLVPPCPVYRACHGRAPQDCGVAPSPLGSAWRLASRTPSAASSAMAAAWRAARRLRPRSEPSLGAISAVPMVGAGSRLVPSARHRGRLMFASELSHRMNLPNHS